MVVHAVRNVMWIPNYNLSVDAFQRFNQPQLHCAGFQTPPSNSTSFPLQLIIPERQAIEAAHTTTTWSNSSFLCLEIK